MTKLRLVIILGFGIFSTLALLGNKNGRASQSQRGNTGAPGDETQGGQPETCIGCHNQGPIVASLAISVLDSANNPVTQYQPGKLYTTRVTITASGNNLNGYGFQMIGLRNSDNSDLDGFSDINPNNYKLVSIPNGRTYAEHNNISASNLFNVRWTAPPSGTGSITFYAAGNGVNSNGTTSGDGSGFSSLQLTEMSSAANEISKNLPQISLIPNPIQENAVLRLQNLEAGEYQLSAFDILGKNVWNTQQKLAEGAQTLEVPAANWLPGIYFVRLEKGGKATSVKVLKL